MKNFKKKIITVIFQKYADFLIERLQNSKSDVEFNSWLNQAVYIDLYCIYKHDIYLD